MSQVKYFEYFVQFCHGDQAMNKTDTQDFSNNSIKKKSIVLKSGNLGGQSTGLLKRETINFFVIIIQKHNLLYLGQFLFNFNIFLI
jgi:hypothetical protein